MWNKLLYAIKISLVILIILTIGYGVYGQIFGADERTEDMTFCQPLDTQWYRIHKDGTRTAIKVPSSETLSDTNMDIIETVLFDDIDSGACISIRCSKQDMKVYIDGELRESYSTKDTRLFGKNSVSRYLFVELNGDDAGKVLRIEISSDSRYLGTVKPIYYGDKIGIWINYLQNNITSIIIPFISFVLAFISVIFAIGYYLKTKKTVKIFYYAVAVMLISMWALSQSSARQLVFNNITVIHDISGICATLFMVPLSIFLNKIQRGRYKKVYIIYSIGVIIYSIGCNLSYILNISDTSAMSIYNFIVIGIGMAIPVIGAIIDVRNKKIQEYIDIVGGFLFLFITGLIQIAMYFIKTQTYEGNAVSIGILVSLIVTIYSTIKDIQKVSNEKDSLKEKVTAKDLKIEKLTYQSLETLASTIDAKDKYTNGHSKRVADYSREIARRMGKDDDEVIAIYFMGLLHDIGKIGIRDDIINKTSRLTDEEFMVIKNHPTIGYNILKNMTEIPNIEYGARWHHERYDGKGYPDGLKGEQIPEYARIICVADAYDAMTSTRSYRAVMPQEKVRNEIENCKGKQFDPIISQIMIEMIDEDINYTMKEK